MTKENKFPNTAFTDAKGEYHADPLNQPYAYQVEAGLTQPHDRGQQEHINVIRGYCAKHTVLGCAECSADSVGWRKHSLPNFSPKQPV